MRRDNLLFIATETPTDHSTKLGIPPAQRDSEAWHGKNKQSGILLR